MKFRAVMTEEQCMTEFCNIISTLAKTSKEIAFNIQPEKILISGCESTVVGAPQSWADISKDAQFTEYQMSGVNDQFPFIVLTATPHKMVTALAALRSSPTYFKIKLTNDQFPCLTVLIDIILNKSNKKRQIIHDIPVSIIPTQDWPEFDLPRLPKFHCTITMPSLRSIRGLVDKLKNIAPSLTLYCLESGQLSLVVETDLATMSNHYRNLEVEINGDVPSTSEIGEEACRIDSKQLALLFASNQFQEEKMFCCIKQDTMVKILIKIREDVYFNSVLWAVIL